MKKVLCILFLAISAQFQSQVVYEISDPVSVTNGDESYGKHHPRIIKLDNGNLLVFWSKGGSNSGLFFSIFQNGLFTDAVQISTADITPNIWGGGLGPEIASSGNHIYVTFEVYGEAIYCVHSDDSGLTFGNPVAAFTPPSNRRATLPSIAVQEDGHPIISYVNTNTSEGDARYETVVSTDYGSTFEPPVNSSSNTEGTEVCECCPGSMIVTDDGIVELAFRNNNNNLRDIWLVKSEDNAQTFPTAIDLDQSDWTVAACPASGPHIFNNGAHTLSSFFSGGNDFWQSGVYVGAVSSIDDSPEIIKSVPGIENEGNSQNFPRLAGVGDTVAVVWHETYNNSREIAMNFSTSGYLGLTSNATINVSDASLTQSYPDVVYSNGKFHIVYEDIPSNTILYQTVELTGTTGIFQLEKQPFEVYPNPASDYINLKINTRLNDKAFFQLRDVKGKKIFHQEILNQQVLIPLEPLPQGAYIFEILGIDKTVFHSEKIFKY